MAIVIEKGIPVSGFATRKKKGDILPVACEENKSISSVKIKLKQAAKSDPFLN